jgi:hypothetical protein
MADQQTNIQLYTIGDYILNKSIETNQEITFDDATQLFEERLNKIGISKEERDKLDYYAKLPDGINIDTEILINDFSIIKVDKSTKIKRFLIDLEEIPDAITFDDKLGIQYSSDTCKVIQYEDSSSGQRRKKLRYMIDKNVCFRILVKSRNQKYSKYFSLMWQFLAIYHEYQTNFNKHRNEYNLPKTDGYVSVEKLYMVEEELEKYKQNTISAIRERDNIRTERDTAFKECIRVKSECVSTKLQYEKLFEKSKKLKSLYDDRMNELHEVNNDLEISKSLLGETEEQLKARAFLSTLNPTNVAKHHYFVATMMPTTNDNDQEVYNIKFISGQQDYIDNVISNFKYKCELRDIEPQYLVPKMYCANGVDLRNNFHAYYKICIRKFIKDRNDINHDNVIRFNNNLRHEIWETNPDLGYVEKNTLFHQRRMKCNYIRIADIDRYISFTTKGIKFINDDRLVIPFGFIREKVNYIIKQTQIANIPSHNYNA